MNDEQLKYLEQKPYLLRAFLNITEEDKQYMETLNAQAVTKEQVRKLQEICKRMTKKMTFREKANFGTDLIKLIKLGNKPKATHDQ